MLLYSRGSRGRRSVVAVQIPVATRRTKLVARCQSDAQELSRTPLGPFYEVCVDSSGPPCVCPPSWLVIRSIRFLGRYNAIFSHV